MKGYRLFVLAILFGYVQCRVMNRGPEDGNFQECPNPIDMCFVLDSSGSVQQSGWTQTLAFTNAVIRSLVRSNSENRIGVVVFSDAAAVRVPLRSYPNIEELQDQVSELRFQDSFTNTADALNVTANQCFGGESDRDGVINVALFLSDGVPTLNQRKLPEAIRMLHAVTEFVISIGVANISEEVLRNVSKNAGPPRRLVRGEDYFLTPSFDILPELGSTIARVACPVQPTTPSQAGCDLDICFVLDRSGSQKGTGWDLVQRAALTLIQAFRRYPRYPNVGVVAFSSGAFVELEVNLNEYEPAQLMSLISEIDFSDGYTDVTWALTLASTNCFKSDGDRPNATNIAIFISDAMVTINGEGLPKAIEDFQKVAEQVVGIGIGESINETVLRRVAMGLGRTEPRMQHDILLRPSEEQLNEVAVEITRLACEQEVPATTTAGPGRITCERAIDLCFVLDSSGSVKREGWNQTLDFVGKAIKLVSTSANMSRVGVVVFSDYASIPIELGSITDANALQETVSKLRWHDGYTNTAMALNITANRCFRQGSDRMGIQNIVIIITDGLPNLDVGKVDEAKENLNKVADLVIPVGVGRNISETFLTTITKRRDTEPVALGRDYFLTPTFALLESFLSAIVEMACIIPL